VSRTKRLNWSLDTAVGSMRNAGTRRWLAALAPSRLRELGRLSMPVAPAMAPKTSSPRLSLRLSSCSPSLSSGAKSLGTSSSAKDVPKVSQPALTSTCSVRALSTGAFAAKTAATSGATRNTEQAIVCATWPPSVSESGMLPHLGPSGHSNCVQSMLPVFL